MKTKRNLFLLCTVLLIGCLSALAQQATTVTVKAFASTLPDGKVRYQYRVINSGSARIVGLAIGYDYYHGVGELNTYPAGWNLDTGIPQGNSASPSGWHVDVITTEENPNVQLEWRNDGTADIMAGQTRAGFSITTDQSNPVYLSGHWTVFFADSTIASARLVLDDNPAPVDSTPPSITVSLTPNSIWPPDSSMFVINANISVHDDQDPNPAVKLVSVTCNEILQDGDISGASFGNDSRTFSLRSTRLGPNKVGRIYTVTYSATDASGNSATTTASVTVPHDQRN